MYGMYLIVPLNDSCLEIILFVIILLNSISLVLIEPSICCRFMLTRQQVLYGLERVELRSTSIFDECPLRNREARQEQCSGFSAMFRTPDGSCNNFEHPSWGASFMPFLRFLPPDYRY